MTILSVFSGLFPGKMWDRIQPPGTNPLNTVSVGKNTVWVVDKFGEHYYRSGVTETFPEGVEWSKIFGRVQSVTVSASDEVGLSDEKNFLM